MSKTTHLSFRVPVEELEHLDELARLQGCDRSELARRYIAEGMRIDEHPEICFRDGPRGRRPAVTVTHLQVATIVATVRDNDGSVEEAARYHEVHPRHIETALRYYAAYRDEVDAWIERGEEIAAREEAKHLAAQRAAA